MMGTGRITEPRGVVGAGLELTMIMTTAMVKRTPRAVRTGQGKGSEQRMRRGKGRRKGRKKGRQRWKGKGRGRVREMAQGKVL